LATRSRPLDFDPDAEKRLFTDVSKDGLSKVFFFGGHCMFNFRALSIALTAFFLTVGFGFQAGAHTGQKYASQAKISIEQARAIAHREIPGGIILDEELEKESGGSGLRYSFDIKGHGVIHEVGVDARTGKVLENSVESKKSEDQEKD
jgi:hypothetical protein